MKRISVEHHAQVKSNSAAALLVKPVGFLLADFASWNGGPAQAVRCLHLRL
jgi:hypothetical protein